MTASRLRPRDAVRLGAIGLRSRRLRVTLSALGIAIGIAAMVAVVGISTSSQARLNAEFDRLGTNLLTITAGQDLTGTDAALPAQAVGAVQRLPGVTEVSAIAQLGDVAVYRNDLVDKAETKGIGVAAAEQGLLAAVGAELRHGSWLNEATGRYPAVVLGSVAAQRLGVTSIGTQILVGELFHTVVGVLAPITLVPELDAQVFVGTEHAATAFGWDGAPTTVYERSADDEVTRLRDILPSAVNPENPGQVAVSRPSDTLAARYATDQTFTGLLVGLGSIAFLVGGIGVANTMIISVMERRHEIGLRRALGATRTHIRVQFVLEALLLSLFGGVGGAVIGWLVTGVVALSNGWQLSVPPIVFVAAVGATAFIGAVAGLYPAIRAARLSPTAALTAV